MESGWSIYYENLVTYLPLKDVDDYNWQEENMELFDLDIFLNSHDIKDKVGIAVVYDGISGGELIIYPEYLSLSLSINRKYISGIDIPDFNWYLMRMKDFFETIELSSIRCETIY